MKGECFQVNYGFFLKLLTLLNFKNSNINFRYYLILINKSILTDKGFFIMEDNIYQRMIDDGVSEQIRVNDTSFKTCALCDSSYTNVPVNLLNCGHFLCTECWDVEGKCYYPGCTGTKGVKIKKYNISGNTPVKNNENSDFQFAFKTLKQSQIYIKKAKGSDTIESIAKDFIAKHFMMTNGGQDKAMVVIGTQIRAYKEVKNRKILDLKKELGLISMQQNSISMNPFTLTQRYKGGNLKLYLFDD